MGPLVFLALALALALIVVCCGPRVGALKPCIATCSCSCSWPASTSWPPAEPCRSCVALRRRRGHSACHSPGLPRPCGPTMPPSAHARCCPCPSQCTCTPGPALRVGSSTWGWGCPGSRTSSCSRTPSPYAAGPATPTSTACSHPCITATHTMTPHMAVPGLALVACPGVCP